MFKVRIVFQKKCESDAVVLAGRGVQAGLSVTPQCLSQPLSVSRKYSRVPSELQSDVDIASAQIVCELFWAVIDLLILLFNYFCNILLLILLKEI